MFFWNVWKKLLYLRLVKNFLIILLLILVGDFIYWKEIYISLKYYFVKIFYYLEGIYIVLNMCNDNWWSLKLS